MRAGKLSKPGKILVYLMSFLVTFSSLSTFCLEAVYAASQNANIKGEEELKGILSVSSIVNDDWELDDALKADLTERDLEATEFTRQNSILGAYTKSGTLDNTKDDETWLSNVMYEGSILRANSFDGFIAVYDNADSAVIKEGVNQIPVTLIPIIDTNVEDNGGETDYTTWDPQYGFVSRFMLPHWNSDGTAELDLKDGWAYNTILFIVGIKNRSDDTSNRIYSNDMMSYVDYLSYIGANPTSQNMQKYLDYVEVYRNIRKQREESQIAIDQWLEWQRMTQDNERSHHHDSSGSDSHHEDPHVDPDPPVKNNITRTVLVYLDGADMSDQAADSLAEMIEASKAGNMDKKMRIVVMTGGTKGVTAQNTWDFPEELYAGTEKITDGYVQLWEIENGKLVHLVDYSTLDDTKLMTSQTTLEDFVKYVRENYPSDIYDLVMWSHGGGPELGFGCDENNKGDTLSTEEIVKALKNGGLKFDFIAFDSCLMANTEIAMALAPYASYLLGAEGNLPDTGIGYSWLKTLAQNPKLGTYLGNDNGIGEIIVDNCIRINKGLNNNPKKDATYSLIDLAALSKELPAALKLFSADIYKLVKEGNQDYLYDLIRLRKDFKNIGEIELNDYTTDLVDIRDLLIWVYFDKYDPSAYIISQETFNEMILQALGKIILKSDYTYRTEDRTNEKYTNGSEPFGLSIYLPSYWRQYKYTGVNSTLEDQIEHLLRIYSSTEYTGALKESMDEYKKALAAYGLWLKTGGLLGQYWRNANDNEVRGLITDPDNQDLKYLADESGLDYNTVSQLIEKQINDRITERKISVTMDESLPTAVTVTGTDPSVIDRVELRVTVNTNIIGGPEGQTQKVSLGVIDGLDNADEGDRTATYDLKQFDDKWLTLNGKAVSYYDDMIAIDSEDNTKSVRQGIIPVAYWIKKPTDNVGMTVKEAIENGYLLLGNLIVEFQGLAEGGQTTGGQTAEGHTFSDTGKIVAFRAISGSDIEEYVYGFNGTDVKNGDVFELLANYDKPGDANENLLSMGAFKVTNATSQTVGFASISGLDAEYALVDIYENSYSKSGMSDNHDPDDEEDQPDPTQITVYKYVQGQRYIASDYEGGGKGSDLKSLEPDEEATDNSTSAEPDGAETATAGDTAAKQPEPETPASDTSSVTTPAALTPEMINSAIASGLIDAASIPVTGDQAADAKALYDAAAAAYGVPSYDETTAAIANANTVQPVADISVTPEGGVPTDADIVPGLDSTSDIITNPVTGEAISTSDAGIVNQDGCTDNPTEYVTPGLSDETSTTVSESSDNSGGDTGSGDGGGSDGGDSGDSDGGSDSDSSDGGGSSDSGDAAE